MARFSMSLLPGVVHFLVEIPHVYCIKMGVSMTAKCVHVPLK